MSNQDQPNIVRLGYHDKPSVAQIKTILQQALTVLTNFNYDGDKCNEYTKDLSNQIRNRLKDLGKDRYKYVVQVMIGERRDQGIRTGTRSFWDANTDTMATETLINDSIFCVATVYAIYFY